MLLWLVCSWSEACPFIGIDLDRLFGNPDQHLGPNHCFVGQYLDFRTWLNMQLLKGVPAGIVFGLSLFQGARDKKTDP